MIRRFAALCVMVTLVVAIPLTASASTKAMLNNPIAVVVVGHTLWIANDGANYPDGSTTSVVAFNTRTDRVVHWLAGSAKGLNDPSAIAATATHVWVASTEDSTLSEVSPTSGTIIGSTPLRYKGCNLRTTAMVASRTYVYVAALCVSSQYSPLGVLLKISSSGAIVQALSSTQLGRPVALALDKTSLWVASNDQHRAESGLIQVSAARMTVTRVLRSSSLQLGRPAALAVVGPNLWVADETDHHLAVIRTSDGDLLDFVNASPSCMEFPTQLALVGSTLWVGSIPSNVIGIKASLVSVNTHTGSILGCTTAPAGDLNSPVGVVATSRRLWVVNAYNDTLVEFTQRGIFLREWRSAISTDGIYGR